MADIINKARTKQRSLDITLLELKNAFCEVHHNLIQTALDYHHILIISNFWLKICTLISKPLQLPMKFALRLYLLVVAYFNVIALAFFFLTCVLTRFSSTLNLSEKYQFQCADDADVTSGQESENQHLITEPLYNLVSTV